MQSSPFDVIVVGSGASGGWAAKRLSEAGVKVAIVDCGRVQTDAAFSEHKHRFDLKYRDQASEMIRRTRPVQKDCYACMEYNYDWFANDLDEPYTTADGKPFSWQGRLRVTGGRTNVWGRQSYRLSDLDFKARSYDGYGEDWPLVLQGSRALLRHRRRVRRHLGAERRRRRTPRRQVPAGNADVVRRDAAADAREAEAGPHCHHRRDRRTSPGRSTAAAPATTAGPASAGA